MMYSDNDEMIYDVPPEIIQVFDVDAQGLFNLSPVETKFKLEFPDTYATYVARCIKEDLKPGSVYFFKERNITLALLVTKYSSIGAQKETREEIWNNLTACFETLYNEYNEQHFASSIMERAQNYWGQIVTNFINGKLHWTVYRK